MEGEYEKVAGKGTLQVRLLVDLSPDELDIGLEDVPDDFPVVGPLVEVPQDVE
jgi:hypothetical protein